MAHLQVLGAVHGLGKVVVLRFAKRNDLLVLNGEWHHRLSSVWCLAQAFNNRVLCTSRLSSRSQ